MSDVGMVTVPIVKWLSKQFRRIVEKECMRIIFKGKNTLELLLMYPRDPVTNHLEPDVVYKESCLVEDCNSVYTGESSRCLETRVKEHSKGIQSNVSLHSFMNNHPVANISHFSIITRNGN